MSIERTAATSKLSPENATFLDDWAHQLKPFSISYSSLIDLCVRIVRRLSEKGELSLAPESLRAVLDIKGPEGPSRWRPLDVALSGDAKKPKKHKRDA